MISFQDALEIAKEFADFGVAEDYGEAQGKYVFWILDSHGWIVPGGGNITVDKENGECKYELLEREFLAPYAPIRGYKKIIPSES